MRERHTWSWPALLLLGAVLLLLAIPGLWLFMSATATRLHPDPQQIPSVTASPAARTAAIERARHLARAHLSEHNLPGLSVAAGAGQDLLWAEGFGFADLNTRAAVTPAHRFRLGTASTALTSAAAGLLLEEGRLKLDEPIQTYVPEFPKKDWPVTLRHLMGHTAGLPSDGGDEGPLYSEHCERPVEAFPHFAGKALLFEPGTQYRFSSYGWIVMGAAIEAASGQPFLSFMQTRVFHPTAMRDTRPDAAGKPVPNRVSFFFPRFVENTRYGLHPMRDLEYSCYAGSSSFLSTPSDLVRFALAVNRGELLKPGTVRTLQTPQRLRSGVETGYGLGWDLETMTLGAQPARVAGHDGHILGGVISSLWMSPEHGIAVAVMSNTSHANTFSLAAEIARAFVNSGPP